MGQKWAFNAHSIPGEGEEGGKDFRRTRGQNVLAQAR